MCTFTLSDPNRSRCSRLTVSPTATLTALPRRLALEPGHVLFRDGPAQGRKPFTRTGTTMRVLRVRRVRCRRLGRGACGSVRLYPDHPGGANVPAMTRHDIYRNAQNTSQD